MKELYDNILRIIMDYNVLNELPLAIKKEGIE